jgi:hypothetical protein
VHPDHEVHRLVCIDLGTDFLDDLLNLEIGSPGLRRQQGK